jgi:hypothetical protein
VNDRYGMPPGATQVQGDHGLKGDRGAIAEAIRTWLTTLRA